MSASTTGPLSPPVRACAVLLGLMVTSLAGCAAGDSLSRDEALRILQRDSAKVTDALAIPGRNWAYAATMKGDLRNLATAQEGFASDHGGRYFSGSVTGPAEISGTYFAPTSGVTVRVRSATNGGGYSATATHQRAPGVTCTIFVNTQPVAPAKIDGEPNCSGVEPTPVVVSRITGIARAAGSPDAIVEFTVSLRPSPTAEEEAPATAVFRHYDDGWRIASVAFATASP